MAGSKTLFEIIDMLRLAGKGEKGIDAWHGTPHLFQPETIVRDKMGNVAFKAGLPTQPEFRADDVSEILKELPYGRFRSDKMGTGEGAQAFGAGSYQAQAEPTAREYMESLASRSGIRNFEDPSLPQLPSWVARGLEMGTPPADMRSDFSNQLQEIIAKLNDPNTVQPWMLTPQKTTVEDTLKAIDAYVSGAKLAQPGYMLRTKIYADPDKLLNWDVPLAEQPNVLSAIDERFGDPEIVLPRMSLDPEKAMGGDFYSTLARGMSASGRSEASQALSEMGIPGTKYLDQLSRNNREGGTSNYVIFDPRMIEITDRFAAGGRIAKGGAGAVIGELIGGAAKLLGKEAPEAAAGIRAYHASPHDFDKFDLSKVGTGEGAQAFGHGFYFAENEPVAKQYRDRLALEEPSQGGTMADAFSLSPEQYGMMDEEDMAAHIEDIQNHAINTIFEKGVMKHVFDDGSALIDAMSKMSPVKKAKGHMYEVDINANPEHLLDWDKPFVKQSDAVRNALEGSSIFKSQGYTKLNDPELFGRTLYDDFVIELEDKKNVSDALRNLGIPGIRYLDGSSRSAGEGTSNYVIFDPSIIDITRKYKKGGAVNDDADIEAAMMIAQRDHKAGGGGIATVRSYQEPEDSSIYGELPELPYDQDKSFNTGEQVRSLYDAYMPKAVKPYVDAMATVAGNPAAFSPMGQAITEARGATPEITPYTGGDLGGTFMDFSAGPMINVGVNTATGRPSQMEDYIDAALNLGGGALLAKGLPYVKPALNAGYRGIKAMLPATAGVAGLTAGSEDAEAGIIGEVLAKGSSALMDALNIAKKMHEEGASVDEIWNATKWYKTPDVKDADWYDQFDTMIKRPVEGRWKTYIDPKNARFDTTLSDQPQALPDVLDFPELYALSPELKDTIKIVTGRPNFEGGAYNPKTRTINIGDVSKTFYSPGGIDPYQNTAAHELEHAIQHAGEEWNDKWYSGTNRQTALENARSAASRWDVGRKFGHRVKKDPNIEDKLYFANPGEEEARNASYRFSLPALRDKPIPLTSDMSVPLLTPNMLMPLDYQLLDISKWDPYEFYNIKGGNPVLNINKRGYTYPEDYIPPARKKPNEP